MDSIRQTVSRTALGLAEYITPVLKISKFRETGVITPAEFVAAGDFLVHHCPTWQWAGGEASRARSYLPLDKQYLCTKGVPCYKRASQLFRGNSDPSRILEEKEIDGGWVDTIFLIDGEKNDSTVEDTESKVEESESYLKESECSIENEDDDEEEAEDLDAFIQSGMLDEADPRAVSDRIRQPQNASLSNSRKLGSGSDGILQTRTYDLYITYDKYYQTARFFLTGYDEQHRPLSDAQMYEDFSQDHAKKTITTESHPHLSGAPMPSIHPCRQAELMKKLMDMIESSASAEGEGPREQLGVHQYLIVFLKFVQTVIPTIEYDFTQNFKIS
ncbi:unnamed protein product [Mesocestoides corti]|uniref:Ubiquitin-like-conjugating enzyme ATG3 n=1 Tax=Mesocestoides corti TaxID=53468 RepID=A0A0R3U274_MESCO|nr:unnamed protein product [Mesocestoides corti]